MNDWNEVVILRNLRSPYIQNQIRQMIKEAERECFTADDSGLSSPSFLSEEDHKVPAKIKGKESNRNAIIDFERLDLQKVIDVERENDHSQLVAMMIFDRNNNPKRSGSIYSYFRPKTKKSWFYSAYNIDNDLGEQQLSSEDIEIQSNKKGTKKNRSKGLTIKTTFESLLKSKNLSPTAKIEDFPDIQLSETKPIIVKEQSLKTKDGIIPPPSSTSPTRRKTTFNLTSSLVINKEDTNSERLSLQSNPDQKTQLKMGKSLKGVFNTLNPNEQPQESKSAKLNKKRRETKIVVEPTIDQSLNDQSAMNDFNEAPSRKTSTLQDSFTIPTDMGMDTSFEMAIQSENQKSKLIGKEKTKQPKKPARTSTKPFLGITSLFK